MSESMNQEIPTNDIPEAFNDTWKPRPETASTNPVETVTTSYNPGLTTLEDKPCHNCESYRFVNVVIGILMVLIALSYFIGGMVVENRMLKTQVEQMQRGLR
jgi:hypothetical protein